MTERTLKLPSEIDLAYAAGLIDGEGTIGITELQPNDRCRENGTRVRKSPQHRIYMALTMTERDAVEWLHAMFGGHFQSLKQRDPRHKPTFRWSMANAAAADFCEVIAPYLKVKRQQAELATKFYREHLVVNFRSKGLPPGELDRRRVVIARVRELNHRGALAA